MIVRLYVCGVSPVNYSDPNEYYERTVINLQ